MSTPTTLRFLIDNALSPLVAESLQQAGYDAVHVRQLGLSAAEDDVTFDLAAQEERVVVSLDTDFGDLLALGRRSRPSVLLFRRRSGRRPEVQVQLLLGNLPQITDALLSGSVVVLEQNRIRIRALPIETGR